MNSIEITNLLPHRYPFLLIDRVVEINLGDSIVAYKNVSANEPFFTGHFPGNPVMPGVLIIEAMAQTCGVLGIKTLNKPAGEEWMYMIVGVNEARFRKPVVPGDQLFLQAKKINEKRGIWKFQCEARVDDMIVAQADLLVAEREFKTS